MIDSKKKSIYKTITWRVIAVISGLITSYIFTNRIDLSLYITLTSNSVCLVLYYIHERLWNNVSNI